jgi:hypothetical protein
LSFPLNGFGGETFGFKSLLLHSLSFLTRPLLLFDSQPFNPRGFFSRLACSEMVGVSAVATKLFSTANMKPLLLLLLLLPCCCQYSCFRTRVLAMKRTRRTHGE